MSGNCLHIYHSNLTIIQGYWFYETHFQERKLILDDELKRIRIELGSQWL